MPTENRKAIFYAVSNDAGPGNLAYSNFVYSLCKVILNDPANKLTKLYNIDEFVRHDMIIADNVRDSVFKSILEYDTLIFLVDELPIEYEINGKKKIQKIYNPNVWFEMGISAPQAKHIIFITIFDDDLPFYAKHVQKVVFPLEAMRRYWAPTDHNENEISFSDQYTEDMYWKGHSIYDECLKNKKFKLFKDKLVEKLKKAGNPFQRDMEISDLSNTLSRIGCGSIFELLNVYIKNTTAEFIPGEKEAFKALTTEVRGTTESLRTTRFANQSIIGTKGRNSIEHKTFMEVLCEKSSDDSIISDRIICNNHYTKWCDIVEFLLHSNARKSKLYVVKKDYWIGFELVIIDSRITFIHFYQLSGSGNISTDGKEHKFEHQVINSTLKLTGKDVAKSMEAIFTRLHHCNSTEPSRTLLGVPKKKSLSEKEKNRGIFILTKTVESERADELRNLLINSFREWYDSMIDSNPEDCWNMGLGIAIAYDEHQMHKEIVEIIKSKDGEQDFLSHIDNALKEVMTEMNQNSDDSMKNLEYKLRKIKNILEKCDDDEIH